MPARLVCLACISLLLLGACRKAEVTAYRVPKEKDPEMPAAAAAAAPVPMSDASTNARPPGMADTAVATASGTDLIWTAPPDWKPKQGSAMRKGSYAVPGDGGPDGDLSITAFPGDVGGELANVNRWRGQVQLPPVAEGDLGSVVTRLQKNGLEMAVVDATGSGPTSARILGAIIPFGGATWFIKLGPAPSALVEKQKSAFLAFLETVKPAKPAP